MSADAIFIKRRREHGRRYGNWDELPTGGRCYWRDIAGRRPGWCARYCLEVDAQEQTLRFWQEIYNADGRLVETHQKFPVDTGHQQVP